MAEQIATIYHVCPHCGFYLVVSEPVTCIIEGAAPEPVVDLRQTKLFDSYIGTEPYKP